MILNLQYFGGRGGSSGLSARGSETISTLSAKIAYNSAKKNPNAGASIKKVFTIEHHLRDIASGKSAEAYATSLKTPNAVDNVLDYLRNKLNHLDGKIIKLGSINALKQNPALYNERLATVKAINAINDQRRKVIEHSSTADPDAKEKFHRTETTTYVNARNRRMKNFDDWFNGGKK